MIKVNRAIIMAAGRGERMNPVTLKTPKPLVSVNGKRMIDSVIDGLHQNGIFEIYIVVGYLREQFLSLEEVYPNVRLIYNPDYAEWNNIASLYAAKEYLSDCMILYGDQIIHDPKALDPYFELSGYNAVRTEQPTKEWLLQTENGIIKSCSRIGGTGGWQLYSISRWSAEDGAKLRRYVEIEYKKNNRSIYWDDIPIFIYPNEFTLGIHPMKNSDVLEIDTLNELMDADPSYRGILV